MFFSIKFFLFCENFNFKNFIIEINYKDKLIYKVNFNSLFLIFRQNYFFEFGDLFYIYLWIIFRWILKNWHPETERNLLVKKKEEKFSKLKSIKPKRKEEQSENKKKDLPKNKERKRNNFDYNIILINIQIQFILIFLA